MGVAFSRGEKEQLTIIFQIQVMQIKEYKL